MVLTLTGFRRFLTLPFLLDHELAPRSVLRNLSIEPALTNHDPSGGGGRSLRPRILPRHPRSALVVLEY